jgi:hypothetical protein
MVSGRSFLPNAPLLCLKWIPACAVTSVKVIGPVGRDTSEADDDDGDDGAGDATRACSIEEGAADFDLHPMKRIATGMRHAATQR